MDNSRFDIVVSAWRLLTKEEKRKLTLISLAQFFLGIFDLIGVAAIAMLGALSVRGVQSEAPGNTVSRFLEILQLESFGFRTQAIVIALFAVVILVTKTILSVVINRRITFFLSQRSARLSADLIKRSFTLSYLFIKSFTQQELIFATTAGVNALTIGVMASTVSLVSDAFLLLLLSSSLLIIQPALTIVSFMIFASTAYFLHRLLTVRAGKLGALDTELNIASTTALVELLSTYRESLVQGSLERQLKDVGDLRRRLSVTAAELSFMPSITKYVMEGTLIVSALALGSVAFITEDAVHAIAMLVLFVAAGFRIAPAILRIQYGLLQIKGSLASAIPTLQLAERLAETEKKRIKIQEHPLYKVEIDENSALGITVKNLNFKYESSPTSLFTNLSLHIEPGSAVAIVGSSGAGKTTLVDLILGVLEPSAGEILIGSNHPKEISASHPGLIGYVPQNSYLINGSLIDNVLLGLDPVLFSQEQVSQALLLANLSEYTNTLPDKLNTIIGDSGQQLSGGQLQRLGIARALVTNPKLLVLDEATSSLDAHTEATISNMINALAGKTTVIVIAHRLATIRNFPRIIFIQDGKVLADGKFETVRSQVPDFDAQARLMGL